MASYLHERSVARQEAAADLGGPRLSIAAGYEVRGVYVCTVSGVVVIDTGSNHVVATVTEGLPEGGAYSAGCGALQLSVDKDLYLHADHLRDLPEPRSPFVVT